MKGLIWFRHDLRLTDNPALVSLSRQCDKALMLYVIDPEWFRPNRFQTQAMGHFRKAFLYQTLSALQNELKPYRQKLIVKVGNPIKIITELCVKHNIDLVAVTQHQGVYEKQQIADLNYFAPARVQVSDSFTLYLESQLNFTKDTFPPTFSQFRKFIKKRNIIPCIPISPPESLPAMIREQEDEWKSNTYMANILPYTGGEDNAHIQLEQYFWKMNGLKNYKSTRNFLDNWRDSSKLSAWLAHGCVSVRTVAAELDKYEYRYGRSGSTDTLFSELLWREYFQWMMHYYGAEMFAFSGIKQKCPATAFYPERLKQWQQGKTDYPIVNACMHQLNTTGYISNRGRQIVASCLVNELDLDWRYGAAYFEQQLIDFDVATNYGNWQYLAGVGADPREKRHFNLTIQTELYDPHGEFIKKWSNDNRSITVLKN